MIAYCINTYHKQGRQEIERKQRKIDECQKGIQTIEAFGNVELVVHKEINRDSARIERDEK